MGFSDPDGGSRTEAQRQLTSFLADYRDKFPRHGSFVLERGELIRRKVREERIPDEPGVYVVTAGLALPDVLCIGRAGTLRQDGSFKAQRLPGLCARQRGQSRQQFYEEQMDELDLEALAFHWFVTFDRDVCVIPAKAEADLVQAFFDITGRLPSWQKGF